jgi:hypothetical protein
MVMGSQNPESPFPRKLPDGRVVVDEFCTCGCKRSGHNHSIAWGHGSCATCRICPKFSFKAFVFQSKLGVVP